MTAGSTSKDHVQNDLTVHCRLLLHGVVRATEALVVHMGQHLAVVACPAGLGEIADIMQVKGQEEKPCDVVFFAVDPSRLVVEPLADCERFRHEVEEQSDAFKVKETVRGTTQALQTRRQIHFSALLSCTPDLLATATAFQETCDATFVPALQCEVPDHVVELKLAPTSRRFLWNSIVIIPDFLKREECHILMDAADRSASVGTSTGKFYAYQGSMNRYPLRKLDLEAQMLSSSVFNERLVPLLERELPDVAMELFGRSERLHELKPFFSPGEPAVNRYMTGGGIAPHIDREAVTLNVVLSEPGAFAGGGTAFWPQEKVEGETDEACAEKFDMRDAAVLRPRQGTAILFNGSIAHAGRPVISGVRHAFVASFNLVSLEE